MKAEEAVLFTAVMLTADMTFAECIIIYRVTVGQIRYLSVIGFTLSAIIMGTGTIGLIGL